jgi:sugar O-acyltransferase (sialic acid O-acetyltransferase NeuD family)
MEKIYILGAGSLCKFVIDILESNGCTIGGIFDDNFPNYSMVLGYPIIGKIDAISLVEHCSLVIAVGEPSDRKMMMEKYLELGHVFPNAIHCKSYMSKHALIGDGVIIGAGTIVLPESEIGSGCCILANVTVNQNVIVGKYSLVGAGVNIGNNVTIGCGCHLSISKLIQPHRIVSDWEYLT